MPFIQSVTRPLRPSRLGSALSTPGESSWRDPLDRHRRDEPVGLDRRSGPCGVRGPGADDPAAGDVEPDDRRRRSGSGRPCCAGRSTQGSIHTSLVGPLRIWSAGRPSVPNAGEGVEERLGHVADGAGAGDLLLGGDQRAGETAGGDRLVLHVALLGPHEVPPRRLLPLPEAALVAAAEEDDEPGREVGRVRRRDHRAAEQLVDDEAPEGVGSGQVARIGDQAEEVLVVATARPREQRDPGTDQVVEDAVLVGAERDPRHRVGDVVVEAGEEPEAVLAGQRSRRPPAAVPVTGMLRALPPSDFRS